MPQIATLKKWPLTALWPHEALNFNPWLADHLEALDDALNAGWTLTEGKVQQVAGEMWVDIVAEMSTGGRACIEAQFSKSNHDHLGKLLTYIAAYEADAAIWIVGEPRPEHIQAITMLNTRVHEVDFFLVRLEVLSVGEDGVKAPLFSLVSGPSPAIKTAGAVREELAGNRKLITEFWMELLPLVQPRVPAFAGRRPRGVRRLSATAGRKGIRYQFATRQTDSECGLVIVGRKHGDPNVVLEELKSHRQEIEAAFGSPLEWVDGAPCRIRTTLSGGYLDRSQWATLQPNLVRTMERFVAALRPHLDSLKSRPATARGVVEEDEEED
jgi:hypothetical protein